QFAHDGLQTWRQNFTAAGLDQANIVGIQWGVVTDQVVVVGAHYDTTHQDCTRRLQPVAGCVGHKTSQGAYDDGSGVLLVQHLAKVFANVSSYYTVAFVEYDGEERGTEGASAFAEAMVDGSSPFGNATLRAVLDMDMFGITWPGTNAPIQVLHNSDALLGVFDTARKAIGVPDDMVYHEDLLTLGSSDFQVYFDQGVPTIFFSSDFGQFAAPGPVPAHLPWGYYPFWHFEDRYETMVVAAGSEANLQAGFQTAADVGAAVLHAMADDPALVLGQ
ncbi:MAG: M28 family peptidase, partial [Halobacteriales archaeon]|nr:M28 family peptidase [Halobacteriales archaeon]